jgi:hypothetical protein
MYRITTEFFIRIAIRHLKVTTMKTDKQPFEVMVYPNSGDYLQGDLVSRNVVFALHPTATSDFSPIPTRRLSPRYSRDDFESPREFMI